MTNSTGSIATPQASRASQARPSLGLEHDLPLRARGLSPRVQVIEALRSTGYRELAELEVELREGQVVLRGTIGSYYLKQRAQAAVLSVGGVVSVRNELNVIRML